MANKFAWSTSISPTTEGEIEKLKAVFSEGLSLTTWPRAEPIYRVMHEETARVEPIMPSFSSRSLELIRPGHSLVKLITIGLGVKGLYVYERALDTTVHSLQANVTFDEFWFRFVSTDRVNACGSFLVDRREPDFYQIELGWRYEANFVSKATVPMHDPSFEIWAAMRVLEIDVGRLHGLSVKVEGIFDTPLDGKERTFMNDLIACMAEMREEEQSNVD